jgi:hypothetical protein
MSTEHQQGASLVLLHPLTKQPVEIGEFRDRKGGGIEFGNTPSIVPGESFPRSRAGLPTVKQIELVREYDPDIDPGLEEIFRSFPATGDCAFHDRNDDQSLVITPTRVQPVRLAGWDLGDQNIKPGDSAIREVTVTLDPNGAPHS